MSVPIPEPTPSPSRVVLVADDEASMRRLVQLSLSSSAYEVMAAADGDEAWRLLCEHRPAVAVLDVRMPGRNGLELTRAIRADAALAHTRVILLTANLDDADIRAGMDAGADVYLTKPFSPLRLMGVVEDAIGRG